MSVRAKPKKQLRVEEASASYLVGPQQTCDCGESGNKVSSFGEVSEPKVDQSGPAKQGTFVYVDISSVDNKLKRIVDAKTLPVEKAPSRARQRLKMGDVLVSMTRPNLNAVAIVPPELDGSIGSTGFHVLRARKVEPSWLFYAVQTNDFVEAMCKLVKGALYPAVRPKDICAYPIPLVPIDEQRQRIAEIEKQFTRLESAVKALRRVQTHLKRYRTAVLKAACEGRLAPTEAELARKEGRDYESSDKLLARMLIERRKKWNGRGEYKEAAAPEARNLPTLPEGWVWASIAEVSTLVQYGSSSKTNEDSSGIPVIRMGNIQDGKFDFSNLKYLPKAHDEFPELLLARGDLLFNRTNSSELVGKTAVYKGAPRPCSFASYLIRVRFGDGCLPDFVCYFINSVFGRAWIANVVSQQVGQANVNGTKLQALNIPLPPLAEQKRIVAEVEQQLSVIEEQEAIVLANLERATHLRQSILQRAFSGQLIIGKSINITQLKPEAIQSKRPNRHFARALLSAEIVHQLHAEPTFGRVKHQKIFHLCEHIAQINEIDGEYRREAAGPLDNKLIYGNEAELKKQKWYAETKRDSYGHYYKPLEEAGAHERYLRIYWADKIATIQNLIRLMRDWSTDRCEIFSTTYAAWNDLLLWGSEATDEAIVHEILNRWHDSKRRISEKRWRAAIAWIKNEGYIPTGFGRQTCSSEKR